MTRMSEGLAQDILIAACNEGRAAEFLDCLFDGGSATVDPDGRLCLATADQLAQMAADPDG